MCFLICVGVNDSPISFILAFCRLVTNPDLRVRPTTAFSYLGLFFLAVLLCVSGGLGMAAMTDEGDGPLRMMEGRRTTPVARTSATGAIVWITDAEAWNTDRQGDDALGISTESPSTE